MHEATILTEQVFIVAFGLGALWSHAAVTLFISLVVGWLAARVLNRPNWQVCLWVSCVSLPAAFTLTRPSLLATASDVNAWCSAGVMPSLGMFTRKIPADILRNIALLIPAGAAAILWPPGAQRLAALGTALAVSPAIEALQAIPEIHRSCEFSDVVNNSLGALLGFLLASGAASLWQSFRLTWIGHQDAQDHEGSALHPGSSQLGIRDQTNSSVLHATARTSARKTEMTSS